MADFPDANDVEFGDGDFRTDDNERGPETAAENVQETRRSAEGGRIGDEGEGNEEEAEEIDSEAELEEIRRLGREAAMGRPPSRGAAFAADYDEDFEADEDAVEIGSEDSNADSGEASSPKDTSRRPALAANTAQFGRLTEHELREEVMTDPPFDTIEDSSGGSASKDDEAEAQPIDEGEDDSGVDSAAQPAAEHPRAEVPKLKIPTRESVEAVPKGVPGGKAKDADALVAYKVKKTEAVEQQSQRTSAKVGVRGLLHSRKSAADPSRPSTTASGRRPGPRGRRFRPPQTASSEPPARNPHPPIAGRAKRQRDRVVPSAAGTAQTLPRAGSGRRLEQVKEICDRLWRIQQLRRKDAALLEKTFRRPPKPSKGKPGTKWRGTVPPSLQHFVDSQEKEDELSAFEKALNEAHDLTVDIPLRIPHPNGVDLSLSLQRISTTDRKVLISRIESQEEKRQLFEDSLLHMLDEVLLGGMKIFGIAERRETVVELSALLGYHECVDETRCVSLKLPPYGSAKETAAVDHRKPRISARGSGSVRSSLATSVASSMSASIFGRNLSLSGTAMLSANDLLAVLSDESPGLLAESSSRPDTGGSEKENRIKSSGDSGTGEPSRDQRERERDSFEKSQDPNSSVRFADPLISPYPPTDTSDFDAQLSDFDMDIDVELARLQSEETLHPFAESSKMMNVPITEVNSGKSTTTSAQPSGKPQPPNLSSTFPTEGGRHSEVSASLSNLICEIDGADRGEDSKTLKEVCGMVKSLRQWTEKARTHFGKEMWKRIHGLKNAEE